MGRRIVLITNENFPFGGAGANLLRLFSLALSEQMNEVQVWMPTGSLFGDKIDINQSREGVIEGVRYKHLFFINRPKSLLGKIIDTFFGLLISLCCLIKESLLNKVDIIIIYNMNFTQAVLMLICKIIFNKKLIFILPEFYDKPDGPFYSSKKIKWYDFYLGIRYLTKYMDGFIVLSYYLKNYVNNAGVPEPNILVMPNLTDPNIFRINKVKPFKENKITIGYSGTPTQKDGIMDLIESFSIINRKYSNTHLLIIGDSVNKNNSVIPQLKDCALKLGVVENVTFTGLVSFIKIPELINSCQILTLTRPNGIFAEAGFPSKLGEYFACKKPVVITRVGDIPTYFKNEEHVIIVDPGDIKSIVTGFEKLLTDSDLCNKISLNAYKWMDNNLNYRNVSAKLSSFINNG